MDSIQDRPPARKGLWYRFLLGPTFVTQVYLPANFTEQECDVYMAFLRALVVSSGEQPE